MQHLASSRLVVRSKSGRKDRAYKAVSEIARETETSLDDILKDAKLPEVGTEGYRQLESDLFRWGATMMDAQKKAVRKKGIREFLGVPSEERRRPIDALYKAFHAKFQTRK